MGPQSEAPEKSGLGDLPDSDALLGGGGEPPQPPTVAAPASAEEPEVPFEEWIRRKKADRKPATLKIVPLSAGRFRVKALDGRGWGLHEDVLRLASWNQCAAFLEKLAEVDPLAHEELYKELERASIKESRRFSDAELVAPRIVATLCCDIPIEKPGWLWEGRIPLGGVTVLDGEPGVGKSLLLADLAARVTRGEGAPDHVPGRTLEMPSGFVWWIGGVDDLSRTIVPRLKTAGAYMELVVALEGVDECDKHRRLDLPADMPSLRQLTKTRPPKLVVVDGLADYAAEGKRLSDSRARQVIAELARFAAENNCAVIVTRPLNAKVGAAAMARGLTGATALAEARSCLLLGADPDDPKRRVLASVKCNDAALPPSIAYTIEAAGAWARIAWHETLESTTADDLARTPKKRPPTKKEVDAAAKWLSEQPADLPEKEIIRRAGWDEVRPAAVRQALKARAAPSPEPQGSQRGGEGTSGLPPMSQAVAT